MASVRGMRQGHPLSPGPHLFFPSPVASLMGVQQVARRAVCSRPMGANRWPAQNSGLVLRVPDVHTGGAGG